MRDQFYLTLPSNSSMGYYPKNTTTKFSTQLPQKISLKGLWEVALVEFHYPCTFQNISTNDKTLFIYTRDITGSYKVYTSDIDNGVYERPETIIDMLNKNRTVSKFYSMSYNKESGHCMVKPKQTTDTITMVDIPKSLSLQLGFNPEKKLPESVWPCNVRLGLPSDLYVYCDFIETQFIGDVMAPLLRIVNVDKFSYMFGDQRNIIFTEPHYVPLLFLKFDNIEVDIRLSTGKPVPFQFGTSCVKLHFRKREHESS